MTFRPLLNTTAALLCGILFCGSFAPFVSAQVVHAYRKPNETDLQWLFGGDSPSQSEILQVGFVAPSTVKAAGESTLVPRCEPCKPVNPLRQPIPPAPRVLSNHVSTGIAPDDNRVVNIAPTVNDSAMPIVQMSGERQPPPAAIPKEEQNESTPIMAPVLEQLPVPNEQKHFLDIPPCAAVNSNCSSDPDLGCSSKEEGINLCLACMICGKRCKNKQHGSKNGTVSEVPDMIGSSTWFSDYGVGTSTWWNLFTTQFFQPTMLLSRPNVIEHFNAEVQNRIWADYRHWNNAVSIGRPGTEYWNYLVPDHKRQAIEQFSFGLEKKILRNTSLELRVPVIDQFSSNQSANDAARSVELGNISVFLKQVLKRAPRWTLSGGVGVMLPTAEDWQSPLYRCRLNNDMYYLVPFLGVQWHPNKNTFGHFVVQADIPIEKNELDFVGLEHLKVEGQQVIHTGVQLGRWIYRNDCGPRPCRLGCFAEVNYAVVTGGTSRQYLPQNLININSIYVDPLDARTSSLTAAVGVPMVFGKLTCTNSVILPISGNEHPFSVGYNFSLSRQF